MNKIQQSEFDFNTQPIKLCECGCGQPAPIAAQTIVKLGYVKGEPVRYIRYHFMRRHWHSTEHFWSKVDKSAGPDACWVWRGSSRGDRYGAIKWRKKLWMAHRLSYTLAYGPIPDGMDVLHRCDNPPCVNPTHLFPGTQQDNVIDKVVKGRQARGQMITRARFTDQEIIAIRTKHANGATTRELATEYKTDTSYIRRIVLRKRWGHLSG